MADVDLKGLSDQELLQLAQPKAAPTPAGDLSKMSDEDLLKASGHPPPQPSVGMDMLKAGAAGIGRGAAQLAGLPGTLSDLFDAGMTAAGKKIGIIPESWKAPNASALSGDALQRDLSAVTGGASDYRGQTTPGRYAGTVGEFVPGAMIGPGSFGTKLLTGAIGPGIGSEFAGHLTENFDSPWVEPAARMAGAILGGIGANTLENTVRGIISPGGGADPVRLAEAARLRGQGIPVTAGQATGRQSIMNAEADTALGQSIAGAAPDSAQAKAFTSAAMKHIGAADDLATPAAMAAAKSDIVNRMQQSLAGVDVPPNMPLSLKVADAADFYRQMTPAGDRIPLIRNIMAEINDAARNGQSLSGPQLAAWRSNLGELLYHPNTGVSGTAYMLRDALDEAIENSMRAMGQADRIEIWREARNQYRNYLAMQDALKVTKASGIEGIVTPKDLMAALAKQDKSGIVTGGRGEIADLARSGMSMLQPLPRTVSHNLVDSAVRRVGPLAAMGAAGFGALQGAQWLGMGPLATGVTTGLAIAKPLVEAGKDAVRSMAMSPLAQRYLENQLVNSSNGLSGLAAGSRGALYSIPSELAQEDRAGRKSGGRVGINHDKLADQLVGAAERAKKGISRQTEPLLNMPDDHIAHALEVANRSI